MLTFSSYTESSKPLFQKLGILNVNQLNNQQTILFMIDLFNNKLLYNFRDIYILNSQLHSYATWHSNIMYISSFTKQTVAIIQYSEKG